MIISITFSNGYGRLSTFAIMGLNVNHKMHQYTVIPRVLYVRRWGLKRWSLAFGKSGRVTYT